MKFKHLLGTACAVALMGGLAQAGELRACLDDINTLAGPVDGVAEMDDYDGATVPGTLNDEDPTANTVEGDCSVTDTLEMSPNRIFAEGKEMHGHFEVQVDDTSGLPTLTGEERILVKIELTNAVFKPYKNKTTFSPAEIVRSGTDGIFSEAAVGLANGVDGNPNQDTQGRIRAGVDTGAWFFLTPNNTSESSFGFILPLEILSCEDTFVDITLVDIEGFQNPRTVPTLKIAECGEEDRRDTSVEGGVALAPNDLFVDINDTAPFTKFLIADGDSGKGVEEVADRPFGVASLTIWNDVINPKFKTTSATSRFVDRTDIGTYILEFTTDVAQGFDGLSFELINNLGACDTPVGTINADNDTVRWELNTLDVFECAFSATGGPVGERKAQNYAFDIQISSDMMNAIPTQVISVSEHKIEWIENQPGGTEFAARNMLADYDLCTGGNCDGDVRIIRNGLNFGPFDWVTEGGATVRSIFRLAGFPAGESTQKGIIFLDNTSKNQDGYCEVTLSGFVNGDAIITNSGLSTLINAGSCQPEVSGGATPTANFGRADVTFSWEVETVAAQAKVDMDRLLANPSGDWSDYGDNGNDAFSLKARSCDTGRFGPHVSNNLSGDAADALVELCNLGDFAADLGVGTPTP